MNLHNDECIPFGERRRCRWTFEAIAVAVQISIACVQSLMPTSFVQSTPTYGAREKSSLYWSRYEDDD